MEQEERKIIFLDKSLVSQKDFSVDALLAYIALRCILRRNYEYPAYYISIGGLKYQLTGIYDYDSKLEKRIKSGIVELHQRNVLQIQRETKNDMLLDLSNIDIDTNKGFFVIVYLDEVNRIMNMDYQGRFSLLQYFVAKIGTINHSNNQGTPNDYYSKNVGTQTITSMAKMVHKSRPTIMEYDKKLEEMNLIYICRATNAVCNEKGEIVNSFANAYGRPEHKDLIDRFQMQRECNLGNRGIKLSKENVNLRRSMKQKYHNILRKIENDEIDVEDIPVLQEVYDFYVVLNQNYDKKTKEYEEKGITPNNSILERGKIDIEPLKSAIDKHIMKEGE